MKINRYIGNGAYCYANSTSMLLEYIGESFSPSLIEVLTGVGLSASLKKNGGLLYFNNQTLFPDLGISKALEILGFDCKNNVSSDEKDFPIDILKSDLKKMPVILGPLDMGHLTYNPGYEHLKGADHYVFAYKIENEEIYLHDPAGFPFVSLSFKDLKEAWKANGIGYKKGYYRYITAVKRVSSLTKDQVYESALKYFKNIYVEGEKKTSKQVWFIGANAIEHVAEQIKQKGLSERESGHFVYFALPLGAKRALDFASFFESDHPKLASLKQDQAKLFGEAHTRVLQKEWLPVAEAFKQLAEVEDQFKSELLASTREG